MNISPTISVNQVIGDVVVLLGLSEGHHVARLRQLAFNFLTERYKRLYDKDIKQVFAVVPENRRLAAPLDMLQWIRLGIQYGDSIQQLEYNVVLSELAPSSNTKPVHLDISLTNGWVSGPPSMNVMYGIGLAGYQGTFSYSKNDREFLFASDFIPQEIIIQYEYDNLKDFDEPILIVSGSEAMRFYIMHSYSLIKGDRALASEFKASYYMALKQLEEDMVGGVTRNMLRLQLKQTRSPS